MQPFEQPPPQRRGPDAMLVVLVGLGVLGMLVLAAAAIAGVVAYRSRRASETASTDSALTETYMSKNGLVVAHYPANFAAKSIDHATPLVSRNFGDGTGEAVVLAGVSPPISDDVNEFSRVLINAMAKDIAAAGDTWTETGRRKRPCFKKYPGLEVEGTFLAKKTTKESVRMCFFMAPNRGYELKSIVPTARESTEAATLRSIFDATEVQ
jgi:hypothetical protein